MESIATVISLYNTYVFGTVTGVMVSMLTSSALGHGFESWSGQIKDYKIGICSFSTKHTALRRKSKNWLAQNQENVFEWNQLYKNPILI